MIGAEFISIVNSVVWLLLLGIGIGRGQYWLFLPLVMVAFHVWVVICETRI